MSNVSFLLRKTTLNKRVIKDSATLQGLSGVLNEFESYLNGEAVKDRFIDGVDIHSSKLKIANRHCVQVTVNASYCDEGLQLFSQPHYLYLGKDLPKTVDLDYFGNLKDELSSISVSDDDAGTTPKPLLIGFIFITLGELMREGYSVEPTEFNRSEGTFMFTAYNHETVITLSLNVRKYLTQYYKVFKTGRML